MCAHGALWLGSEMWQSWCAPQPRVALGSWSDVLDFLGDRDGSEGWWRMSAGAALLWAPSVLRQVAESASELPREVGPWLGLPQRCHPYYLDTWAPRCRPATSTGPGGAS